jgi:D-xylose transport system permease protein
MAPFFTAQNVSNLFRQMTVTSFLAIGMVFVIVTGNIDLSVGKLAGFVSVVAAYFQANVWYQMIPDQPLIAAILSVLIGVGVGVLFGVIQGYIIAYLNVPAFIVTLGGMFVLNGLILLVTQGKTIPANQPYFSEIAQGYLPPLAGWVIAAIVVVFLFWNMFRSRQSRARHGFELPNMGWNWRRRSSFRCWCGLCLLGEPISRRADAGAAAGDHGDDHGLCLQQHALWPLRLRHRRQPRGGAPLRHQHPRSIFLIFVLMGLLSGIAGIVLASYVGYGTTAAGQGYELDAIASAILGGTSTLGGVGTVFGALIGSLIMSSLTTGLQMLNVAPAWQYLVKGGVLVLAVYADVYFKKKG